MSKKAIAILHDPIEGLTDGEHHYHSDSPHGPLPIKGRINGNVSNLIKINNLGVAVADRRDGSTTEETDGCCGGDNSGGIVITGYDNIKINGLPVAIVGSEVKSHNGKSYVESSTQDIVLVNV